MKQTVPFLAGCLALTLVTACSVSKDDFIPPGLGNIPNSTKTWPEYSDQELSGKVFAEDWKAVYAIARPMSQGNVGIEFYPEVKANACKSSVMSSKPYATVVVPGSFTTSEYSFDMDNPQEGANPLVFSVLKGEAKSVIATKTKIRINSISATSLNASVYAVGTDTDGTVNEINGKIDILDCAKVADFSEWDAFVGWHTLTSFDGKAVRQRDLVIRYATSDFYSRPMGRYMKSLDVPLLYAVGENSDGSYNFGPIADLGTTTVQTVNGVKTYKYSYHGPTTFRGVDIQMNLDVTAIQEGRSWKVTYTLDVPGHVKATTHSFTTTK